MPIRVDESNLKQGLLTLLVALVEVIQETLERQAVRRMEGGSLTEEELERLGQALLDLDRAIEQIKADHALGESVAALRSGLDDVVDQLVERLAYDELATHLPQVADDTAPSDRRSRPGQTDGADEPGR